MSEVNTAPFFEVIVANQAFFVTREWADALLAVVRLASADDGGLFVPITLVNSGNRPIAVIKEVRSLLNINLREAKRIVDKTRGVGPDGFRSHLYPNEVVKLGTFPWRDVPKIKQAFEAAGAVISIPSPLEMLAKEAE